MYPIFQHEEKYLFSNSFLSLLCITKTKYKLNLTAVNEKLATGYLIGENCIVDGIKKIQYDFPYDLDESLVSLIKFPKYDLEFDLHNDGRNKSIIKTLTF